MQRMKCKIAYDGTNFSGFQIQPNKRTIQGELENALQRLHKGSAIKVYGSGRTDAGVHARGQVIHFDTPFSIPEGKWGIAINSLLPDDISIVAIERVDSNFHARFDVVGKEYRFFVYTGKERDPFRRNFAYFYPFKYDLTLMERAAEHLIGTHDFTSFCSAKTEVEDRVRNLHVITISEQEDMLIFRFVGNGFLYNMVRILVGTLLQVGSGDIKPDAIPGILAKRDRTLAGKTAPPQGLYLWEVTY